MTTIMNNNRKTQVEEFEQTKLGVKGLIDSGITQIPPIFHHPPENLIPQPDPTPNSDPIPVINLLNTPREELVNRIGEASRKYGFFQVVNHGVGVNVLDNLVKGIRRFHELPGEERRKYYGRGVETGCNYFSNVDLFVSKAASWIDTLQLRLGPSIVNVDAIPQICRDEILEWDKGVKQLGELLLGLFSEGLGTNVGRLKELSCLESRVMVGHYYPYCPEPEKTVGIASHADPNVFTVLLQDQVGGLQVKHDGKWVDVKPIPGALVINVGDLLQTSWGRLVQRSLTRLKKKMTQSAVIMNHNEENYDREKEVNEFEQTKLGVKGLVDSGITQVPRMFHHPPEKLIPIPDPNPNPNSNPIPVIDLLGTPREEVVNQVREASGKYGFFQVVNHGIPVTLLDSLISAIKAFHEMPGEERMKHYVRSGDAVCSYFSNRDLFVSKAASWRDTFLVKLGPSVLDGDSIPDICREEVVEWAEEVKKLGELLLGLFSEGLGVRTDRLKELTCLETRTMVGQCYPYCPEPEKTVGIISHADPGIFTVLLQDHIGGLQIKHDGNWLDVKPTPGALIINVGDLLQVLSNDKYTSADHRVYANYLRQPRYSVGVLFNPSNREQVAGPFAELVSAEEPVLYREFILLEFFKRFMTMQLDGKTLANYFRKDGE